MNKKATQETIEDLSREIEGLMSKLDQISMNIVSQRDVEGQHFERKSGPYLFYVSCSGQQLSQGPGLDELHQAVDRVGDLRRASLLHHELLHTEGQPQPEPGRRIELLR